MVSECQNSKSEEKFFKNLLPLAKQLETLRRTREFKIEFENEKPNFPFEKPKSPSELADQSKKIQESENEDLKMQVYEDKDYDIEEIKFWNFVSKNKGIKPNVIRTIVYKVPEASYIVRKVPVIVEEFEEKPILNEGKDTKLIDTKSDTRIAEEVETESSNQLNKTTEKNQPRLFTSSKKDSNELKFNQPFKFDAEDIIVIDEDDDIIGFEENESEEEKQSIIRSDDTKNDKKIPVDEDDDDIIEENYIEKNNSIKPNEPVSKQEMIEVDDKLSLLQKSFNIHKKQRRGRPAGRPKVVSEKADEPASTISIKKSSDHDIKTAIKSKNFTSNLNKTLPIISQTKSINTRKSLNLLKKQDLSESFDQVSSSCSNISTV
ncbi:hypothetical protein BpHYR1_026486 [Brachionus plicatilis]|uniref:Uncharacterized protein n=1 Tax=Brachionus plicatilis TaxID=10195 RepID=A0A3M7QH62_BRAPC|nr:hypothetical protein BpHYR1_026486 [Brachionus plicatilis]